MPPVSEAYSGAGGFFYDFSYQYFIDFTNIIIYFKKKFR